MNKSILSAQSWFAAKKNIFKANYHAHRSLTSLIEGKHVFKEKEEKVRERREEERKEGKKEGKMEVTKLKRKDGEEGRRQEEKEASEQKERK